MREDVEHAKVLSQVVEVLPPIIVHAETMKVIDGWHRVLAARLCGKTSVRVLLYHGTEDQAYLFGVSANTTHGMPLTLAERLSAVSHILELQPGLSDRRIADVCGVSPRTVAARRKAAPTTDVARRVGVDGRTRPLSSRVVRQQAAELMLAFPKDSNRSIGRRVGLSEGTVRAVRRQMARGGEPPAKEPGEPVRTVAVGGPSAPDELEIRESPSPGDEGVGDGSRFASWLVAHSVSETAWAELLSDIPLSQCPQLIVEVARSRTVGRLWPFSSNSGSTETAG